MFTALSLKIKIIFLAVVAGWCAISYVWIGSLRSDVNSLNKEVVVLETRLAEQYSQYEALTLSCKSSVSAVEKACSDDVQAQSVSAALKNELKTPNIAAKKPLKSSNEGEVIPTYVQPVFNGLKASVAPTNGEDNEEAIARLDDRLDDGIIGVLNKTYCAATNGGDSCFSSSAISNQ